MIPAILGLGGLTAKIIASAVIPRVVRAISSSFSTTKANEPCPPPAVEGISSVSDTPPVPPGSGVFVPRESLRKWGYAGLWHHQASGLDLATYRAYDPVKKGWISRDPLGEGVDTNLYRYCGNDPINRSDPSGLLPEGPEAEPGAEPGAARRRIRIFLPRNIPGQLPSQSPFEPVSQPSESQYNVYQRRLQQARNEFGPRWQYIQNQNRQFEAHHPWPQFFGGKKDQPLVRLDPMYHTLMTSEMNKRLKGRTFCNDQERVRFMEDFYRDFPLIPYDAEKPGPKFEQYHREGTLEPDDGPVEI